MDKKKLKEVLENHKHWLNEDCDGWQDMRANLCMANLCRANLSGADLREANLRGADLSGADLSGANLYMANLYMANLCMANLCRANLYMANLSRANLSGANLRGADLRGADLRGAKNVPFIPLACPGTGAFVGFKKARLYSLDETKAQDVIVELEIPADARRNSATGRKCRCDKAKVLSITTLDGVAVGADAGTVHSNYDPDFVYNIGEIVIEPNFCEDRWEECAPGIHFFINRQEAVQY